MPFSYQTRLRRDLDSWQERGLISAEQAKRIAADAFPPASAGHLQAVFALCAIFLVAPAVTAFVAANWSAMSPQSRFGVLLLGNALSVVAAALADHRHRLSRTAFSRHVVDGLATLSLAFAAGTLAFVGQTFHVAPDLAGFARTVAVLGLITALVARSGSAALVAGATLLVSAMSFVGEAARPGWDVFWLVGSGLIAASLMGWWPWARATLFLLLLAAVQRWAGAGDIDDIIGPGRLLTTAALALIAGHLLGRLPEVGAAIDRSRWRTRLRHGGEALFAAAIGLCLVGIVATTACSLGLASRRVDIPLLPALASLGLAALLLTRRGREAPVPRADLLVVGAAALGLATLPILLWGGSALPFLTVWGGIVPALMLIAGGYVEGRHGLLAWGIIQCGGLTLFMLSQSPDLIGFSANLLIGASLIACAPAACRWAVRCLSPRST